MTGQALEEPSHPNLHHDDWPVDHSNSMTNKDMAQPGKLTRDRSTCLSFHQSLLPTMDEY